MKTRKKIDTKKNKRLFQSDLFEKLSKTHISVPITLFFILISVLLYWNVMCTSLSLGFSILLFGMGMFSFTGIEYLVHRHLFHMPVHTPIAAKIRYIIHDVHHEFPNDKNRLAMPPLVSMSLAVLVFFFFKMIMNDFVFAFFSGFLLGYNVYLFIHYAVHAYPPPKNFLKKLWINHSIHHHKHQNAVYGVSSPLWDYICGTMKMGGK